MWGDEPYDASRFRNGAVEHQLWSDSRRRRLQTSFGEGNHLLDNIAQAEHLEEAAAAELNRGSNLI